MGTGKGEPEFWAAVVKPGTVMFEVSGVDEPTRRAFELGTCNGCHGTAKPNVDTAFHVSPFRQGVSKLSPFVYDPQGGPDELKVRSKSLMRAACAEGP